MLRNIINPLDLEPFLKRLEQRHPTRSDFIRGQLKSYILKKENVFILPDQDLGLTLWLKKITKRASAPELSMLAKQGVWGNYLKLNLNEECFQKYAKYLDFSCDLDKRKFNNSSFEDLIIKYQNRPAKKRIKLMNLSQGRDFKYFYQSGPHYLLELLTSEAFVLEGTQMKNCLGTHNMGPQANKKMISVRNSQNKPVMTIQIDNLKKCIIEAKGFANSAPNQELLNKLCLELKLKHYPRRYPDLYSSLAIEIFSHFVMLSIILLPSVFAFLLISLILLR